MNHDWLALLPVSGVLLAVALSAPERVRRRAGVAVALLCAAFAIVISGAVAVSLAHVVSAIAVLVFQPWLQRSRNRARWLQLAARLAVLQVCVVLLVHGLFSNTGLHGGAWRSALLLGGSTLASFAVLCGVAPYIERRLGWNTRALWNELSQPYGSPLVAELQAQEPAVFHLSRVASEIAAAAGVAVGADPATVRAAAMHADVGRLSRARNSGLSEASQSPSLELSPELECRVEFDHVQDSVSICREHDLPELLTEIVGEHHGTLVRREALICAAELRGLEIAEVEIEPFRYPGPKPSTKESAAVQAGWFLAENLAAKSAAAELESAVSGGEWAKSGLSERECSLLLQAATRTSELFHPQESIGAGATK